MNSTLKGYVNICDEEEEAKGYIIIILFAIELLIFFGIFKAHKKHLKNRSGDFVIHGEEVEEVHS